MELRIDLGSELEELEEKLLASQSQIQRAVTRTLKKTAKWLETHSKRELGVALELPQRVLTTRFYHSFSQSNGKRSVNVWFGLNPISVSNIGKLRQTKLGVRAGKHLFQGAFIATMQSGHRGVYKRSSKSSLPIEEQRIDVETLATPIIERYFVRAEARFKEILKQELNFILNIEKL